MNTPHTTPPTQNCKRAASGTAEEQFREAASRRGLILPNVLADGRLDRCAVEGGKTSNQDGAYILHLDGVAAGGFQNWKDGQGWQDWKAEIGRTWTPAEKAEYRAKIDQQRAERNKYKARRREAAQKRAARMLNESQPAMATHPYIAEKQIGTHGVREYRGLDGDGLLVIPACSADGTLHTLQLLGPDGAKRFLKDGLKRGCFHTIGNLDPNGFNLICEGFATAASCHEATGLPAVVAFDAGNLEAVAEALQAKYPNAAFTLCADDDAWTEGNPGLTKATEAARAIGGKLAIPVFSGERKDWSDFNDLCRVEGLAAVQHCIEAATVPRPAGSNGSDGAHCVGSACEWQGRTGVKPNGGAGDGLDAAEAQSERLCADSTNARWEVGADGRRLKNEANARYALELEDIVLRHNVFSYERLICGLKGYGPRFDDDAADALYVLLWNKYGLKFSERDLRSILSTVAHENSIHPVLSYLDGCKWDGVTRLDGWLHVYLGAEDTMLNTFIGKALLVAAVRRVRQPGVKFDYLAILEGPQGVKKSMACQALCPDAAWFSDSFRLSCTTKETMELTAGKWVVEIGELAGMKRADVEHIKSLLSCTADESRLAYGRRTEKRLRQFIFVGTTNDTEYLLDKTGNRRFWPVRCGEIDVEAIARDRDQLWAEASLFEAQGEQIYPPEELFAGLQALQTEREVPDEWVGIIGDWLDKNHPPLVPVKLSLVTVARQALCVEEAFFNDVAQKRAADCMRKNGWKSIRSHGKRLWIRK